MSKNISSILNIVLLIAVIILFVLHFNGTEAESPEVSVDEVVVPDSSTAVPSEMKVYYVNTDSISLNYLYAKSLEKTLKAKREQSERVFKKEVEKFEKDVKSFQEMARFMTQQEGEKKQEELVVRERELALMEKDLSERLLKDQESLNRDLRDRILSYMEKVRIENGYTYILGYSETENNVLVVDQSLDLTNEILEGLNAAYEADQTEE